MFIFIVLALLSNNSFAQNVTQKYVCDHQGFSPMEIRVAIAGYTGQLQVVRGTGQDSPLNPEGESAKLILTRFYDGWSTFSGNSTRNNASIRYLEFRAPQASLRAASGAFRAVLVLGRADGTLSSAQLWNHDMTCQKVR
jgi:hypothetical protein